MVSDKKIGRDARSGQYRKVLDVKGESGTKIVFRSADGTTRIHETWTTKSDALPHPKTLKAAKPAAPRAEKPTRPKIDDNPEWTDADFAAARPADDVHGPEIAAQMVRKRGRPPLAEGKRKESVKLRLSPEVLSHFRADGPGWQTRIDEVLRVFVTEEQAARRVGLDRPSGWRDDSGRVYITFKDARGDMMFKVFDVNGKLVEGPAADEWLHKLSGAEPDKSR